MTTVNIHAAKTNFSQLVDQAAAGEEIMIAKAGQPIEASGTECAPPSRET